MYLYRWYKLLSIDIDDDSVSMEQRVNVLVPCEILVEAEKTGELELIIQQCVVFEVTKSGDTDDQR
jgi:hypothetical protein